MVMMTILGAYWVLVARPEQQGEQQILKRLQMTPARANTRLVKAQEVLSSVAVLDVLLRRWGSLTTPLHLLVTRSGVRISVGALMMTSVLFGLVLAVIGAQFTTLMIGLILGLGGASFPFLYVRRAATKRLEAFEQHFPEAIDLMGRALRAGHAVPTALQMVGDEGAEPVAGEFKLLFEQQNFGLSLPEALRAFAARIPLLDARFFVTAVLTQRETGGNLSEVLDRLAAVMRERFKVKRQVRVMSAHGRITGWVLSALPPVVAGILSFLSPDHMRTMIDDPAGVYLIVAALTLQVVGVAFIRKIVNVEY
jgi:tight adherence protein B